MSNAVATRLYTPMDVNGKRKEVDLLTSVECVMIDENTSVKDKIEEIESILQFTNIKPERACLWIENLGIAESDEEGLNSKILKSGKKQFYQTEVPDEEGVWLEPLSSEESSDIVEDMPDINRIKEIGLDNKVAEDKYIWLTKLSSNSV